MQGRQERFLGQQQAPKNEFLNEFDVWSAFGRADSQTGRGEATISRATDTQAPREQGAKTRQKSEAQKITRKGGNELRTPTAQSQHNKCHLNVKHVINHTPHTHSEDTINSNIHAAEPYQMR